MDDINVIVVRRTHKRFLYLRHICPVTGKKIWKSSGTEDPERAQKLAGAWQTELERGLSTTRSASWSAFREAYEDHASVRLRETTLNKICSMFNVVEDLMSPDSLRRISPRWRSIGGNGCQSLPTSETRPELGSRTGNDLLGSKVSEAESGSQSKTDEGQSCHWRGIRQAPRCSFHCLSRHTTKRSAEPVINDVSSAGALALWPETRGGSRAHVGSMGRWNPGRCFREVCESADSCRS